MSDNLVTLHNVEGLRTTPASLLPALVGDALRLHVERLQPECVADLYALAELGLPGGLGGDLETWAARATREIADLTLDGRRLLLAAVEELSPGAVPGRMRDALRALAEGAEEDIAACLQRLDARWAEAAPEVVTLPEQRVPGGVPTPKKVAAPKAPRAPRAPKTPAAQVDPRRAEYVREDVLATLKERTAGVKETILVAGIKMRAPFSDMAEKEIASELRKMERERKLKKTAERWLIR